MHKLKNPVVVHSLRRCRTITGLYRPIHGGSMKNQNPIEAEDQNPDATIDRRAVEDAAEKLCKLLTNQPDPSVVESVLNTAKVEVSPALVADALKKLSNGGVVALSFFKWAEKQRGFKYTAESYNALIEALGKIKQFRMIWNLVGDMKRKNVLGRETFALISRRYAKARKVKEAIETLERMEMFGMKPDTLDYNRLIDNLSKSKHVKDAHEVFDKMKKRRFAPDVKSYTILLEGWGKEHNLLRVKDLYGEMRDEGLQPDVVTFGMIIHAHCKVRKYDEAIEIFREMEAKNCKPSPHIYCTLINGLGSMKRLDEVLEFFRRSKASSGFSPEIPTYNALVGSYCWSVQLTDAYRVVEEMRRSGVGPNSRTYDIILHHLIRFRRTEEAYSVFQEMSCNSRCDPALSTYEIIVRMFCNEGRVDMALRVWNEMKAKGVLPGMHMFFTLVNSLCQENKLEDACKYFEEMLDTGIRPPGQLFSNLKQALLDEGKEDVAIFMGQRLEKLRKTPLIG